MASREMKKIIGVYGSITVVKQEFETDDVFVTFNEFGFVSHGDRFWGDEFFRKCGFSSVGIVTSIPNWYPEKDMQAALPAIRAVTQGRRVITYGHSQGGYGALKFSRALDAHSAIAFCPQYSIDPDDVGLQDKRFSRHFKSGASGGKKIISSDLCSNNYLIYDRGNKLDDYNASMIASIGEVDRVLVPFTGHETVRIIAEAGIGGALIGRFCGGKKPTPHEIRNMIRAARANSPTYATHKARYILRKLPKFQRHLVALLPQLPKGIREIYASVHLSEIGLLEEAGMILEMCNASSLKKEGAISLWRFFRRTGQLKGEVIVAKLLREAYKDDCFLQLHAVNTYIQAGMQDDAEKELDAIIARFGTERHVKHIQRFAQALGRSDILKHLEKV